MEENSVRSGSLAVLEAVCPELAEALRSGKDVLLTVLRASLPPTVSMAQVSQMIEGK